MMADSGARMVIGEADTIDTVREACEQLQQALDGDTRRHRRRAADARQPGPGGRGRHDPAAGERSYDELRAEPARAVPPLPDPEKLAALLYTSGTSGLPRAAMLSHRALLANIDQVAAVEPPMMHGDDVVSGWPCSTSTA